MRDAFIAVPGVGLGQVLWFVELAEAVLDTHVLHSLVNITQPRKGRILVFYRSIESWVKSPASFGVELNCDLELRTLW